MAKEKLIIIGGAEDKIGEMKILTQVSNRINKDNGELVIATVASEIPKDMEKQYIDVFTKLGVKKINILDVRNREDAHDKKRLDIMNKADLVFFTGGDQLRITSILGGTPLYDMLLEKYKKDCVFAGTSAGASIMSNNMIVTGPNDESPKKCTLKMAPGIGLINGVIVDQHFAQRGRIGRLLVGIAENPYSLGIGIDEDTAIVVNENRIFKVIGSGAVYVIDGSSITHTNVSEQYPDEVLSIFDVKMHVLKSGNCFDLNTRQCFREDII
jgi:cyanophycinase